ncbi:putative atp-binding domain 1 family member b [Zalerion maritima]|uniref:GPN-loop GTPase 2 n=1 Tax=Zalerion maritima TaxID=339359 RepID=A0AAD5RXD0_9PEZI|nr:putative atp-binding domain 1 family member b [Zalerion maritima]
MPFAQLVVGGPGSGKSTYCDGMHQFLGAIGRQCSVVNLDPANDQTNYDAAVDIRKLVTLEEIMSDDNLGPNGGVLYALEELEANFEWLEKSLKEIENDYILFDCPGQVELYTHHNSLRRIFLKLQKLGYRLVAVHLSDSFCLIQPSSYIANLILSLRAMLQLDLPHVNVMTKIDKIASYDKLPFNLEFYTEVHDLSYLLDYMEDGSKLSQKFSGLNKAISELVESFGLVNYEVLAVENKKSMMHLLQVIDRANGYVFGSAEGANDSIWQVAMRNGPGNMDVPDIQERWVDLKDEYDAKEREEEDAQAKTQQAAEDGVTLMGPQGDGYNPEADPDFGPMPTVTDSGVKVFRKK